MTIKVSKLFASLLIASVSFSSCQMFFGKDDNLTLKREANKSKKLKLNGYYYIQGNDMTYLYFLYENGTILNAAGFNKNEWAEHERELIDKSKREKVISLKYNWGVYQIRGDSIQFERWHPSERPYRTALRKGVILNDTTFIITKVFSSKGTEAPESDVYHYKRFSTKIDSITTFID